MKRITNIRTLATLLMASAAIVSCSVKEDIFEEETIIKEEPAAQPAKVYTLSVNATKGGDDEATKALSLEGKTLNATWATSENVYVKKGSDWATGSLQPEADGATATLKGSLSGITIAKDDELTLQFPKQGEITYGGQLGTLSDIAENFDYATATVTVKEISNEDKIILTDATTTFTNQQAIVKFTLKQYDGSALPANPTSFTVFDGTNITALTGIPAATYATNGDGVLFVALPGFSGQTVKLTAVVGESVYIYEKTGVTFNSGQYYAITVRMKSQIPFEGAVEGKFTVNESGDRVYFSKGNLQYVGSWQFAANQWECFGTDQRDGHRDLFGWGTKDSPNKVSGNNGDYSWAEWGDNTITNGLTGYRTLTYDEWRYLFFNRDGKSGLAKINVSSNYINGVLLLPDDWTLPDGCSFTPGYEGDYGNNTYSEAQWAIMEKAGAVFLPAAGGRVGNGTDFVNDYPYYWSSTMHSADDAYDFSYTTQWYVAWAGKSMGMSVRLVKDDNLESMLTIDLSKLVFNITVNNATAAEGAKTVWKNGDVVYVFFENNTTQYVKMTYNGTSWEYADKNGGSDYTALALSIYGKKLSAVYFPDFVCSDSPTWSTDKWTFGNVSGYYQTAVADYVVTSTGDTQTLNATLDLATPSGMSQVFIPNTEYIAPETGNEYVLCATHIIPFTFTGIVPGEAATYTAGTIGFPIKGYETSVAAETGYCFCGILEGAGTYDFDFQLVQRNIENKYAITSYSKSVTGLTVPASYYTSLTGFTDNGRFVTLGYTGCPLWATGNLDATNKKIVDPLASGEFIKYGFTTHFVYPDYANQNYTGMENPLSTEHDAAYQVDNSWRLPSKAQFEALAHDTNTSSQWMWLGGNAGRLVTSKINGISLFFRATGDILTSENAFKYINERGKYLSSTPSEYQSLIYALTVNKDGFTRGQAVRGLAAPIRPVKN